jgi:hypothetical protein
MKIIRGRRAPLAACGMAADLGSAMRHTAAVLIAAAAFAGSPAMPAAAEKRIDPQQAICLLLESAARSNSLPLDFFARVIWQESRFDADAVGPVTRSGRRAQGIAQFMPGTAAERRLLDPFDPVQALPKSAEFLRELRTAFGNLGLAAAAYNAGPRRVREWLAGTGFMPSQTRHYVLAITGRPVEDWKDAQDGKTKGQAKSCREIMALLKAQPNAFVAGLEQRIEQGARQQWGVQLAGGFSRARALSAYARVMKRFTAVLDNRDPMIVQRLLRSRGTRPLYQIRIGADTRAEADTLCGRLRDKGGACIVLRTARAG